MVELKHIDSLDHMSISMLKALLVKAFGEEEWPSWEPETISLELGIIIPPLLLDKIKVLQILEVDSSKFYEDPLFFLYSTEVINNEVADFNSMPVPTSLELAYAIYEVSRMYKGVFSSGVKKTISYILNEEGYSEPINLFGNIIDDSELSDGQTKEDTLNKNKAIDLYISGMSKK